MLLLLLLLLSCRVTASTKMNDVSSRSHAIFTLVFSQVGLHTLCCVCSCVLVHRRDSVVKGTTREENNTNKTPLAYLYCHGARLLSYLFLHDKQFGNILSSCDVVRHFLFIFLKSCFQHCLYSLCSRERGCTGNHGEWKMELVCYS